jgi:hypothetical protein
MSVWTHVNGIIRIDHMRFSGDRLTFPKSTSFEDLLTAPKSKNANFHMEAKDL